MKINVSQIRKNPGATFDIALEEELSPVEFPGEILAFRGPVKIRLKVMNTGRYLDLKGELEAETELKCGRCLEPFHYHVQTNFEEKYCHATEVEEGEEDQDIKVFEGDLIDITPELIETLIIGLPMKPICSPDCKGFCPHCGQNLQTAPCNCKVEQIDPRLEVLKNLFPNK